MESKKLTRIMPNDPMRKEKEIAEHSPKQSPSGSVTPKPAELPDHPEDPKSVEICPRCHGVDGGTLSYILTVVAGYTSEIIVAIKDDGKETANKFCGKLWAYLIKTIQRHEECSKHLEEKKKNRG